MQKIFSVLVVLFFMLIVSYFSRVSNADELVVPSLEWLTDASANIGIYTASQVSHAENGDLLVGSVLRRSLRGEPSSGIGFIYKIGAADTEFKGNCLYKEKDEYLIFFDSKMKDRYYIRLTCIDPRSINHCAIKSDGSDLTDAIDIEKAVKYRIITHQKSDISWEDESSDQYGVEGDATIWRGAMGIPATLLVPFDLQPNTLKRISNNG